MVSQTKRERSQPIYVGRIVAWDSQTHVARMRLRAHGVNAPSAVLAPLPGPAIPQLVECVIHPQTAVPPQVDDVARLHGPVSNIGHVRRNALPRFKCLSYSTPASAFAKLPILTYTAQVVQSSLQANTTLQAEHLPPALINKYTRINDGLKLITGRFYELEASYDPSAQNGAEPTFTVRKILKNIIPPIQPSRSYSPTVGPTVKLDAVVMDFRRNTQLKAGQGLGMLSFVLTLRAKAEGLPKLVARGALKDFERAVKEPCDCETNGQPSPLFQTGDVCEVSFTAIPGLFSNAISELQVDPIRRKRVRHTHT